MNWDTLWSFRFILRTPYAGVQLVALSFRSEPIRRDFRKKTKALLPVGSAGKRKCPCRFLRGPWSDDPFLARRSAWIGKKEGLHARPGARKKTEGLLPPARKNFFRDPIDSDREGLRKKTGALLPENRKGPGKKRRPYYLPPGFFIEAGRQVFPVIHPGAGHSVFQSVPSFFSITTFVVPQRFYGAAYFFHTCNFSLRHKLEAVFLLRRRNDFIACIFFLYTG